MSHRTLHTHGEPLFASPPTWNELAREPSRARLIEIAAAGGHAVEDSAGTRPPAVAAVVEAVLRAATLVPSYPDPAQAPLRLPPKQTLGPPEPLQRVADRVAAARAWRTAHPQTPSLDAVATRLRRSLAEHHGETPRLRRADSIAATLAAMDESPTVQAHHLGEAFQHAGEPT